MHGQQHTKIEEWNHSSVLGGREWPDSHPISFKPGEEVFVPFDYEAGRGQVPVWEFWPTEQYSEPTENRTVIPRSLGPRSLGHLTTDSTVK